MDILDIFLKSNMPCCVFNQRYHIGRMKLRSLAIRVGRLPEYLDALRKSREFTTNSREGKGKFNPVSQKIKKRAMNEYLSNKGTTKEIASKFGFNERRLREWFVKAGELSKFEEVAKRNIHSYSSQPISLISKIKISGINSINYHGGIKLDVRRGWINGVSIRRMNHPDATVNGYVPEHRLVMEKLIGRRLRSDEIVHHIDLDPSNNSPENLLLIESHSMHGLLHTYFQYALVQLLSREDLKKLTNDLLNMALENKPKRKHHKHHKGKEHVA